MLLFFFTGTIVTFLLFIFDKYQSKNNKWRIPEWILLLSTLFFGTFGAILGMIMFRHKVSKIFFKIKFFIIVAIQIIFLFLLGYIG